MAFWKKQATDYLAEVFSAGQTRQHADIEKDQLFEQIGRLKVELDFSQKKELASPTEEKRRWIDPNHPSLSIRDQCALLGLASSSYYYQPQPESAENLRLLRRLDQL